jgi:hypothetical protein
MAEVTVLPTDEVFKQIGAARYYNDGSAIVIVMDPNAQADTRVMPAPGKSELEREAAHQNNLRCIAIEGYMVLETKRIHNGMFDKRGDATTWQYKCRMCKNEDEANAIHSKILEVLGYLERNKQRGSVDVEVY